MPEPEDILDKSMESVGNGTLENDGTQPSQSQGATDQEVVDLDKDCAQHEGKKMEPRSDVWNHFTKIKDDKGIMRAAKYLTEDLVGKEKEKKILPLPSLKQRQAAVDALPPNLMKALLLKMLCCLLCVT